MGRGFLLAFLGLGLLAGASPAVERAESRASHPGSRHAAAVSAVADTSDSVYALPPIRVEARRIPPEASILSAPGQVSIVDVEAFRFELGRVAETLDRIPGLTVAHTGSAGHDASVSIRGHGSSRVRLYLDGVPLTRSGLGLMNLAELPFAGLDHIEVYRGFAPPDLPGNAPGGAIQLVTPRLDAIPQRATQVLAAAGSFGTERFGLRQDMHLGNVWRGFFVADGLRSDGDFPYRDDPLGTWWTTADDVGAIRKNNWVRSDEILAKVGRALPSGGRIEILHQWVGRSQGVPGFTSQQAIHTRQSSTHHLTNATLQLPAFWNGRVQGRTQVFHDWRRDRFLDERNEIGLGFQDNRDVSQTLGCYLQAALRFPAPQRLSLHLHAQRETFMPWRRYPLPEAHLGPEQSRNTLAGVVESSWMLSKKRLHLLGSLRFSHERDRMGGLRTAYSRDEAASGERRDWEPRLASRLRLLAGIHVEASYSRHHRSPGFLELFGDAGSVAGSSDLVAESGTNRDIALDVQQRFRGVRLQLELAHYRNRVDHLITFIPQSQVTFVARNIGAARLQGEELQWWLGSGQNRGWSLEGNYTRQRTEDLGVDTRIYAGKSLPGRPESQFYARAALRFGNVTLGYDYRYLTQNFLDRWNQKVVGRRDLHGFDIGFRTRALLVRLAGRNLTDSTVRDVAGFPVPGRTFSLGSELRF